MTKLYSPWTLVDVQTGVRIELGSTVKTFRGEKVKLIALSWPKHEGSSGKITVASSALGEREFYPNVIGATYLKNFA